jgi:hypothetical protein
MNLIAEESDVLTLQASDGTDCFPFADAVGTLDNFPQSENPQCQRPEGYDNSETVCAFSYVEGQACN